MEKLFSLIFLSFLCQAFADSGICVNDCGKSFGVLELSSACTKGCNYFDELANLFRSSDSNVRDDCERGCNHRYNQDTAFEACNKGCATKHQQMKETEALEEQPAPSGEEGPWLFVLLRRYFYDEKSQSVVENVRLIKLRVDPKEFDEEMSLRSPDQLVEESSVVTVEKFDYLGLIDLLVPLCLAAFFVIILAYLIVILKHRFNTNAAKVKAANLAVALQHEPIKLVLPEDLTKLSLIDDDEAPPLPQKQPLPKTDV